MNLSEIRERLAEGFAKIDAADKACPVRSRHLSIDECPACRATAGHQCGKVSGAEFAVLTDFRALLSALSPQLGQGEG